jgi:hypothetical protein
MWSFYLSLAFIAATFATMYPSSQMKQNLSQHLNDEEQKQYEDIIIMRRNIYMKGLVLGVIIALSITFVFPPLKKTNRSGRLFLAVSITFFVNYFYYILHPKDKYMIEILNTKEENESWLAIYKTMQFRYHIGFLFGLAAAGCIHHGIIFYNP